MKFLLVEDSKISVLGIQKIIEQHTNDVDIVVAENGQLALDVLLDMNGAESLPCFIMLDLNMPVMDGKEFLSIIRKDKRFGTIPVVIHTTSSNKQDYLFCSELGISGYYVKNVAYKTYKDNILCISNYWFNSFRDNL